MSVTIDILGLAYFHTPSDGGSRRIFMPDGRKPDHDGPEMQAHYASFFVEEGDADPSQWWPPHPNDKAARIGVIEYRVMRPSTIVIPQGNGGVDAAAHDERLPELRRSGDSDFEVDLEHADTVARTTLSTGILSAHLFTGAGVSRWRLPDAGATTIRALSDDGETILVVRDGAHIVFANTSDLLSGPQPGDHPSHYRLYARLAKKPKPNLKEPPLGPLEPLPSLNRYLTEVEQIWSRSSRGPRAPLPGCSNTCC